MVEAEIEAILNEAIGLKLTSIGSSTLDRAVNRRMRALEIADNKLYLTCLKSSPAELKQLIEEVVIPETWFFRDEKPFQVVQRFVAAAGKDKVFRLLSAPCSTGEEPYSLVITLLQAGVPESNFQVVGMDISSRALKKAAAATYSENSFRTIDLGFRSRYFKKTGAGYVLDDQVRRNVTFKQGNLLNQAFMEYLGKFDIIFCRNLLIYLDRKAQQQSLDTLARLQAKDGLFFVGHAEAGIMRGAGFRAVSDYTTLAFQKIGDQEGSTPRAPQDMAAGQSCSNPATLKWRRSPEQLHCHLRPLGIRGRQAAMVLTGHGNLLSRGGLERLPAYVRCSCAGKAPAPRSIFCSAGFAMPKAPWKRR